LLYIFSTSDELEIAEFLRCYIDSDIIFIRKKLFKFIFFKIRNKGNKTTVLINYIYHRLIYIN